MTIKPKKITRLLLYALAMALLAVSLLSLLVNTESRYLKMLDFPRMQYFIVAMVGLGCFAFFTRNWQRFAGMIGMLLVLALNGYYLINYTPLVEVAVPSAVAPVDETDTISILLANVKMSNREAKPLLDLIANKQPDIVLTMEVDTWWEEELAVLKKKYPHQLRSINEVTYGMQLLSKYPLGKAQIQYLNNDNVPSFSSTITLKNGKEFRLFAVHPVPPTHFKELPDNLGQKEKSMKLVGQMASQQKIPVVVAGDINDVVWAATNQLTKTSNLLFDVRVGRGFFNSYNAQNILTRWPLDHYFVTKEFKVKQLERLPEINSDHFPMYAELVLE